MPHFVLRSSQWSSKRPVHANVCWLRDKLRMTHAPWDSFAYSLSRQEFTSQHFACIFIPLSSSGLIFCLLRITTNRRGNFFLYSSILRRLRNIAKSDYCLCHVCLSVRPSVRNNSAPGGRIIIKFDISRFLGKHWRKLKSDKNMGYFTWRPTYIYDISLTSS
jgi:hypothetical protein